MANEPVVLSYAPKSLKGASRKPSLAVYSLACLIFPAVSVAGWGGSLGLLTLPATLTGVVLGIVGFRRATGDELSVMILSVLGILLNGGNIPPDVARHGNDGDLRPVHLS